MDEWEGNEEVWKGADDTSAICKKGRGIEGEAKETHFGSAKVLTGICLLPPPSPICFGEM